MVHVCAWCERFLGPTSPELRVSHGICSPCLKGLDWEDDPPVLVLSRRRAHLLPVFRELLRGTPGVRVVVDRREGPRRQADAPAPAADRRRTDRRRQPDLTLN
jgi:hypothetical protein